MADWRSLARQKDTVQPQPGAAPMSSRTPVGDGSSSVGRFASVPHTPAGARFHARAPSLPGQTGTSCRALPTVSSPASSADALALTESSDPFSDAARTLSAASPAPSSSLNPAPAGPRQATPARPPLHLAPESGSSRQRP